MGGFFYPGESLIFIFFSAFSLNERQSIMVASLLVTLRCGFLVPRDGLMVILGDAASFGKTIGERILCSGISSFRIRS
jgi:hypothetical protein